MWVIGAFIPIVVTRDAYYQSLLPGYGQEYAQAIKKRIGVQIDTKAVDKELEGYQAKLKEVDLNKTR